MLTCWFTFRGFNSRRDFQNERGTQSKHNICMSSIFTGETSFDLSLLWKNSAKNICLAMLGTTNLYSVLSVEFCIGGKIFRIDGRKIRWVFGGRLGPLMLKWYKILHSGHFLGLKLLYFLSCFLLHNLQLLLLMSIEID